MNNSSGVGVLDKAVCVLAAVESGPATLAQLVKATGLARPTTHRIAVALEHHRLLARDVQGRFVLGPRIGELASAAGEDRLLAFAQPVLIQLRDLTGESAQLYRRQADVRVCVAAAERASGLRDTVPVGAALPMTAGSAAQVLLAWEEGERMHRGLRGAKFTATTLASVRRRGWAASAAEREPGVASVSAPVRGTGGKVLAAISVSGPIERLTRSPGRLHAAAVVAAGEKISDLLRADQRALLLPRGCAACHRGHPRAAIEKQNHRDHEILGRWEPIQAVGLLVVGFLSSLSPPALPVGRPAAAGPGPTRPIILWRPLLVRNDHFPVRYAPLWEYGTHQKSNKVFMMNIMPPLAAGRAPAGEAYRSQRTI